MRLDRGAGQNLWLADLCALVTLNGGRFMLTQQTIKAILFVPKRRLTANHIFPKCLVKTALSNLSNKCRAAPKSFTLASVSQFTS